MLNEFDLERYHILLGEVEDLNNNAQRVNFQMVKQSFGENIKKISKNELNSQLAQIYVDRKHVYEKLAKEADKLSIVPTCVVKKISYVNDDFAEKLIKKYHVNSLPFMIDNYINLGLSLEERMKAFSLTFKNNNVAFFKHLAEIFLNQGQDGFLYFASLAGLINVSAEDVLESLKDSSSLGCNLVTLRMLKDFLISTLNVSNLYNNAQRIKIMKIIALLNDMIMMKELIDKELDNVRAVHDIITLNSLLKENHMVLSRQLK